MKIFDSPRGLLAIFSLACLMPIMANAAIDAKELLTARCLGCHSGAKARGGFDMTQPNAWKHREEIVSYVRDGKMPMGGTRLTSEEVAAVSAFLETNPPALSASTKPREFWSFRDPVLVTPPDAKAHPIDAFIRAKLTEKGLRPAPPADPVTLRRRLSFDMTGLPPSAEEAKLPYTALVDKYLGSRHYAERWARHWLDVVRFGETDGGEHNYERFHAWPYRDYVIDAFLTDKPYNQFVREQIAGDLIEPGNVKMVAATGFLVSGPWDQVQAEINKDKAMAMTQRMDELDDMVTTVFHTFQGMTVNCARCHDHKFDPIPTRDYYKTTAAFQGVGFGTRQVATPEQVAARDAQVKPLETTLKARKAELAAIEDPVRTKLLREKYIAFDRERAAEPLRIPLNPIYNRNQFRSTKGGHWRLVITAARNKAKVAELTLLPAGLTLRNWTTDVAATPDKPVIVPLGKAEGQVNEMVWATNPVTGTTDGQVNVYRLEHSQDGSTWNEVASSLGHVQGVELDLPTVPEKELEAQLPTDVLARRGALAAEVQKVTKELAQIPALPQVYAAKPAKQGVQPAFVLERGSVTKPGEPVQAGALSAVKQIPNSFGLTDTSTDAERRLALANWLTSEKNPLTARVIVNRVWYFHFGTGLVNTPSDFGLNGDRPSHPELLDWLAINFMQNGWSLKWLHRQILLSQTYQQSAQHSAEGMAVDADNRLYWRMPLRRMDAEMLRDNILYAAGNLDLQHTGGPSFMLQKKGDAGSYIYKALDNDGPEVWKRAVYRFVVRGGERIFLDSFDCPDPAVATPQRSLSNTPVQALTLLNNSFVWRQAGLLATKLAKEKDPVGKLYATLYGRQPTAPERTVAKEFLGQQSLALFTRALFNSSEFLYVP